MLPYAMNRNDMECAASLFHRVEPSSACPGLQVFQGRLPRCYDSIAALLAGAVLQLKRAEALKC